MNICGILTEHNNKLDEGEQAEIKSSKTEILLVNWKLNSGPEVQLLKMKWLSSPRNRQSAWNCSSKSWAVNEFEKDGYH